MADIKILDAELEIDMFDANIAEKAEKVLEKTKKAIDEIEKKQKEMKFSEYIRETCHITFECFNGIFGEGTDRKIFGNKCNLLDCGEAMLQLEKGLATSQQKKADERFKPYLPNRQTRRAK